MAGDAVCVNPFAEPAGHSRLKTLAVAVTLSLKLMTTAELTGTLVAPDTGVVLVTVGAASPPLQDCSDDVLLRGFGASAWKSALFTSVSVQPAAARIIAIAFDDGPGAAEPSAQLGLP
jgi:hypothetical protein